MECGLKSMSGAFIGCVKFYPRDARDIWFTQRPLEMCKEIPDVAEVGLPFSMLVDASWNGLDADVSSEGGVAKGKRNRERARRVDGVLPI